MCRMARHRRRLGASAAVHDLRARGLLRLVEGQACEAHAGATGYPIVESFEPGEDWFRCYVDEVAFRVEDAPHLSYVAADTEHVRKVI